MELSALFFINSIFLGIGLAMDAFSVSIVNGINEPHMGIGRASVIAGVYAFFQALMPMTGWFLTHGLLKVFSLLEPAIPWISLLLLLYIGLKMLLSARCPVEDEKKHFTLGTFLLLSQGLATSLDALSVGFTIAEYGAAMALLASLIISAVTFIICLTGVVLGKKLGLCLAGKANFLGGIVLIGIGIEIFVTGIIK